MNAIKLLESGKYSDLTISCDGRDFKVHKAILCPQSEVITKLCDVAMRENRTGVIEHQEFDKDTMQRMIDFAYKRNYEVTQRPRGLPSEEGIESLARDAALLSFEEDANDRLTGYDGDGVSPAIEKEEDTNLSATDIWVIHARVYGLADYYDMSDLRDYAQHRFEQVAENKPEDVSLDGFINVAREVGKRTMRPNGLTANDNALRTMFLSLVSTYAPKLASQVSFITALCDPELVDITVEIFRVLGQRMVELEAEKKEIASSLQAETKAMQRSLSNVKADKDYELANAKGRLEQANGVTDNLIRSLRNLPAACLSNSCTNEFGDLNFEMKGNGEWQVRCGKNRCRCRLN